MGDYRVPIPGRDGPGTCGAKQNGSARDSTFAYTFPMAEPIQILTVERDGGDGLLVTFSDGTIAGYVTEELLELRPFREPVNPDLMESIV